MNAQHNYRGNNVDFMQKVIIPLDSLMQTHGVSHWDDSKLDPPHSSPPFEIQFPPVLEGLFLHVTPQQIQRITSEQAQQWWDSGSYPPLIRFIDGDDCEVQNTLGSSILWPFLRESIISAIRVWIMDHTISRTRSRGLEILIVFRVCTFQSY